MTHESPLPHPDTGAELFVPLDGREPRCPAPELLSAARAGTLPAALQEPVAAHLASCALCQVLVDALDDDSATGLDGAASDRILARVRPDAAIDRRRRPRQRVTRWAVAAAVAMVAGASWLTVLWNRAPDPTVEPPAAGQASGSDASIIFAIGPAPLLPADTFGSASDARSPAEQIDLLEPLAAYLAGNYDEAANRFATVVSRHPRSTAGHFYLGMSELLRGRETSAIPSLETASQLAAPRSEEAHNAAWYLALAFQRTRQPDRATARLTSLCETGGPWAPRACAALGAQPTRRILRGVVRDAAGTPLADVRVGEHRETPYPNGFRFAFSEFVGRSDGTGQFAVSGETSAVAGNLLVRAAKPGYFTATAVVRLAPEMEVLIKMHPWVLIAANQTLRDTTRFDPICEATAEHCRRYAVTAPPNGLMDVAVSTLDRQKMDLWVELPDGSILAPMPPAPLRLTVQAEAGATYQILVLSYNEPRDFELSIQLK